MVVDRVLEQLSAETRILELARKIVREEVERLLDRGLVRHLEDFKQTLQVVAGAQMTQLYDGGDRRCRDHQKGPDADDRVDVLEGHAHRLGSDHHRNLFVVPCRSSTAFAGCSCAAKRSACPGAGPALS